jgi:hypothetical protein
MALNAAVDEAAWMNRLLEMERTLVSSRNLESILDKHR